MSKQLQQQKRNNNLENPNVDEDENEIVMDISLETVTESINSTETQQQTSTLLDYNFYQQDNDYSFMNFATTALLNMPYSMNANTHPRFLALNELINQYKASQVFGQYNYIERVPAMSIDNDDTLPSVLNEPFQALAGTISQPVCRILESLKQLERVKYRKAIISMKSGKLQRRVGQTLSRRKKNYTESNDDSLSRSIREISTIFNRQSNEKPELFYTDNSVYLRYLAPVNVMET